MTPIIVEETPASGTPGPTPALLTESYVLDPAEVAIDRFELDITSWVRAPEGIDWGDAQIEQYLAEASRGQLPVDFRIPNRTIQIPLVLKGVGDMSFAAIRSQIQAKVALFQREGGWLKRTTAIGTVFADVTGATLKLGGSWYQAAKNFDVDAVLTLECIPDFYGNEVDLGDNVETTATELIFTETGIDGDYPSRMRIVVDNDSTSPQLGLIYGIRSRHYSNAATAALRYEAEALTALDQASITALSGASGGNVVRHQALATVWTPVLSTGSLTHTGTYRVWARAYTTADAPPQLRLVWDVGDLTLPVENAPASIPGGFAFHAVDLGEVRLDAPPVGTHKWIGQIQAKAMGTSGGPNVSIDKVWIVPVDEGYGVLRSPPEATGGFTAFSARDEFKQTGGVALSGQTATLGGAWGGGGDADDFTVVDGDDVAQRTAVSDTAHVGRVAPLGSNMTTMAVQVDIRSSSIATLGPLGGVLLRYVDNSNYAAAWVSFRTVDPGAALIRKTTADPFYSTFVPVEEGSVLVADTWYTVRAVVTATGHWWVWIFPADSVPGSPVIGGQHSDLATGGTLASGKPGLFDYHPNSGTAIRQYRNFQTWVPNLDAVLHASHSAELRTDGMFREDSAGTAYGPVSHVVGDLPRLPPAGLEGRTTEVFIKASRGDFDWLPDGGIDDISARVFCRPSWLIVPG